MTPCCRGLDADTAYTLQISTCRIDTDSGSLVCDGPGNHRSLNP